MSKDPLREAAKALMVAVQNGEELHGGLIDREMLRLASLLRIEIDAAERREAAVLAMLDAAMAEEGGA